MNISKRNSIKTILKYVTNPRSWLFTLEIIWVILLSILGNFIFNQKINPEWSIDFLLVWQFTSLIINTISYSVLLFNFKKCYDVAEEKDRDNYHEWISSNKKTQRKKVDFFFWNVFNKNNFWLLLISFISLLAYLCLNSKMQ